MFSWFCFPSCVYSSMENDLSNDVSQSEGNTVRAERRVVCKGCRSLVKKKLICQKRCCVKKSNNLAGCCCDLADAPWFYHRCHTIEGTGPQGHQSHPLPVTITITTTTIIVHSYNSHGSQGGCASGLGACGLLRCNRF